MGDDKILKEQFQILQEQKRKRLIKQNEMKFENIKSEEYGVLNELDENLNLQVNSNNQVNIKETDDYKDLQETVRELRDENGRLDKLLAEKDEEIKIVRRRWKAEREELAGGGVGSGNAASKIIESSKKIRELNTAFEKEKSKSQSLEKKINMMERSTAPPEIKPPPTKDETDIMKAELLTTKEKLNNALMKSAEGRNENDALKKELKIAQKVLTREVGDNIVFQSLLNGSSGWRGRQQQILALQLKVTELQQQLDASNQAAIGTVSSKNAFLSGISQHDEKHRLVMRRIELEKKEQQDKMQKELVSITAERDSYKEKNNAARARNKIITQDLKNIKQQLSTVIDKGKHDDELVSALLREQQYLKEENEKFKADIANKESLQVERVLKASGSFSLEKSENDDLISKLKDEIKIQEERVKELESEITHLRSVKSSRPSHSLIPRPLSTSSSRSERLLQRPTTSNTYQENESLNLLLQESRSFCEVANVEKEKLSELLQVLQKRNEELIKELLGKDFAINEYKNSNVTLQKRNEKLTLSQNNSHVRGVSGTKSGNTKKKNPDTVHDEVYKMETKLSIQLDNNNALKTALEDVFRAKEADSKYYHQMIEHTKNIFLQGLRQYRQAQDES